MSEVKWIKITTEMFDNRKIKYLRKLPEGNNIVLIWVMLLTMAGRCNSNGMLFLTENIPYTPKMIADELDFEENTVVLALNVLEKLDMVVSDGRYFAIAGWEEYQNVDQMERLKEMNRERVAKYRNKKTLENKDKSGKKLQNNADVMQCNVTAHYKVMQCNGLERDIDKDIDINNRESSNNIIKAPSQYGKYSNVKLTDEELHLLKSAYPDYLAKIDYLSVYIKTKGKSYANHYAVIVKWADEDAAKQKRIRHYDADELEKQLLQSNPD